MAVFPENSDWQVRVNEVVAGLSSKSEIRQIFDILDSLCNEEGEVVIESEGDRRFHLVLSLQVYGHPAYAIVTNYNPKERAMLIFGINDQGYLFHGLLDSSLDSESVGVGLIEHN